MSRRLKEWRNYALTPIGAAVPILLGSASIFNLDAGFVSELLIGLVALGAVLFVVLIKVISRIENIALTINSIQQKSGFNIAQSQGFISSAACNLSKFDYNYLVNYVTFTNLLMCAINLSYAKKLKELSVQHKRFPNVSKAFEAQATKMEKMADFTQTLLQSFDRTKPLPPDTLKFVEGELTEYGPLRKENA